MIDSSKVMTNAEKLANRLFQYRAIHKIKSPDMALAAGLSARLYKNRERGLTAFTALDLIRMDEAYPGLFEFLSKSDYS